MLSAELLVVPDAKVMRDYRRAEDDIVTYAAARAEVLATELGVSPRSAAVRARFAAEANEHSVRLAELRRLAALAKMAAVVEWTENLLEDPDAKVVLAAHHRDVVDALAERFGGLKIQGGMRTAEIERAKSRFQDGDGRVIVLSIQAAKTGHTLTAAQDIGFVELPYTPDDLDQTASRLHRLGQAGVVTAHRLLAAGTIDERINAYVESKRSVVNAVVDGKVPTPDERRGDPETDLLWEMAAERLED